MRIEVKINRNVASAACLLLACTVAAHAQIAGIGGDPITTTLGRIQAFIIGAPGKTLSLIAVFLLLARYAYNTQRGHDTTISTIIGIVGLVAVQAFANSWFF